MIPKELENIASVFIEGCDNLGIDLVAVTSQGSIVEINENRIVNSCFVDVKNSSQLEIFYRYDGHCMQCFYIIHATSGLLVIIRKNGQNLTVIEKLDNVQGFFVADVTNSGQPDLMVISSKETYPFKFPSERIVQKEEIPCLPSVLKDLKDQLDILKSELLLKKTSLKRHLDGGPPTICITDHWQRVYQGWWLTGFTLTGFSNKDLDTLHVVARGVAPCRLRWSVYTSDCVNSAQACLVVGVVMTDQLDVMEWSCQYELRYGNNFRIQTPALKLSPKEMVLDTHRLFLNPLQSGRDMACVELTHASCELEVCTQSCASDVDVKQLLESELGLKPFGDCYLIGGSTAIATLIINIRKIFGAVTSLALYTGYDDEMFLIVKALKAILPYGTRMEAKEIGPKVDS